MIFKKIQKYLEWFELATLYVLDAILYVLNAQYKMIGTLEMAIYCVCNDYYLVSKFWHGNIRNEEKRVITEIDSSAIVKR